MEGRILLQRYLQWRCRDQPRCTIVGRWQLIDKSQWCRSANTCCSYNTHHRPNQPHQAFTPYAKHSPDDAARARKQTSDYSYSVYRPRSQLVSWSLTSPFSTNMAISETNLRPRKDERLSRPGWQVTYRNKVRPPGVERGHVTHIPVLTRLDVE